jgi:hypothetical protein
MQIDITYDLIKYVMGHWLLYALFFLLGMIFMFVLMMVVYFFPTILKMVKNMNLVRKYLKFVKENKEEFGKDGL